MVALVICSAAASNPRDQLQPQPAVAPIALVAEVDDLETAASAAAQPQFRAGHHSHIGGHHGHLRGGNLNHIRIGGPGGFRATSGHRFRI